MVPPRWYLEHVYPESQMPLDYFFLGEMRNDASHNCLDTMGRKSGEEVATLTLIPIIIIIPFITLIIGGHELLPRPGGEPGVRLHQEAAGGGSRPPDILTHLASCSPDPPGDV